MRYSISTEVSRKIVFYGAGVELETFFANLSELDSIEPQILVSNALSGFHIEGIIDSNKYGQEFYGYVICHKDRLKTLDAGIQVVISSSEYFQEIRNEICCLNPKLECFSLDDIRESLPVIGYCNICGAFVKYWRYCGRDIRTKYKIIGNGRRIGACPSCQCVDRNRWAYYVLKNYTRLFEEGGSVLHFAPEKQIECQIRKNKNIDYYTADIAEGMADYIVDMTDMKFEDHKFDYIIANHVLEHITDEEKALSELIRCIKKDGKIILSVPYTKDTNTFEMTNLSDADKEKYYGQEDHVRLYGRDLQKHLNRFGLTVKVLEPEKNLSKEMVSYFKLIGKDKVIICSPVI